MILESKSLRLRLIEEADAEFIISLRLDERYNQYLSKVDPGVEAQQAWIRSYKADEHEKKQFYFIIERLDGVRCGTIRVYDLRPDSFCWGSWILNEQKTRFAAVESAFLIYQFGFETLGYMKSHFDVMKGNDGVIKFHKRMGAVQTGEDENNYYFEISRASVDAARLVLAEKIS